jgi:1-aminocyclopropane-1-carboxylate deaminase
MTFFNAVKSTTNQSLDILEGHRITVKREDLIHKVVSGNKFRKLRYNFEDYLLNDKVSVLTFGGAFSNHLAATAYAGKMCKIPTIGIVRGEEWENKVEGSRILNFCRSQGMDLRFVSRAVYREKEKGSLVKELQSKMRNLAVLPEGGTNELAVKGCEEILTEADQQFDAICCCIGTGGTMAGLVNSTLNQQFVLGFNALNNPEVSKTIKAFTQKENWSVFSNYTFGGYAKVSEELIVFMNNFYQQYQIPLDPIYTGKMLFGIFDLIKSKQWSWGKNILVIHSGGLQGIEPMNLQLKKKRLPLLHYGE